MNEEDNRVLSHFGTWNKKWNNILPHLKREKWKIQCHRLVFLENRGQFSLNLMKKLWDVLEKKIITWQSETYLKRKPPLIKILRSQNEIKTKSMKYQSAFTYKSSVWASKCLHITPYSKFIWITLWSLVDWLATSKFG